MPAQYHARTFSWCGGRFSLMLNKRRIDSFGGWVETLARLTIERLPLSTSKYPGVRGGGETVPRNTTSERFPLSCSTCRASGTSLALKSSTNKTGCHAHHHRWGLPRKYFLKHRRSMGTKMSIWWLCFPVRAQCNRPVYL